MRKLILAAGLLSAGVFFGATGAQADPYRWCAEYGGGRSGGGGTNCYFMTIQQCRAAISGLGGFCRQNNFYDGKPVRTPEDSYRQRRTRYQDDWNYRW
jgi:hypothetical protein